MPEGSRCRYSEWEATSPSGESGAGSDSGPPSGLSGRRSFRWGSTPGGFGSTVSRSSFFGGGSLGFMSPPAVAHPLPVPSCVHAGMSGHFFPSGDGRPLSLAREKNLPQDAADRWDFRPSLPLVCEFSALHAERSPHSTSGKTDHRAAEWVGVMRCP